MIANWNSEDLTGKVFHFQNSLRPFIVVYDNADNYYFLDLNENKIYTYDELEYEDLFFYHKDEDDDFMGVEIDGRVEWVG